MDRTHRLDTDMDEEQTRDGAAFLQEDDEQWLRIVEQCRQSRLRYLAERQIQKPREQSQARPGSLEVNGTVARMMATMGYVPSTSLGKKGHLMVLPPRPADGHSRTIHIRLLGRVGSKHETDRETRPQCQRLHKQRARRTLAKVRACEQEPRGWIDPTASVPTWTSTAGRHATAPPSYWTTRAAPAVAGQLGGAQAVPAIFLEKQRRLQEQRLEQARSGSLWANGAMARTMAAMGYDVPSMTIGESGHRVAPPPNSHSRFGAGADQDFGEQIDGGSVRPAARGVI
ncbi:hypothetical protein ACQ4PT_023180 [Festuca glaucescens]